MRFISTLFWSIDELKCATRHFRVPHVTERSSHSSSYPPPHGHSFINRARALEDSTFVRYRDNFSTCDDRDMYAYPVYMSCIYVRRARTRPRRRIYELDNILQRAEWWTSKRDTLSENPLHKIKALRGSATRSLRLI